MNQTFYRKMMQLHSLMLLPPLEENKRVIDEIIAAKIKQRMVTLMSQGL